MTSSATSRWVLTHRYLLASVVTLAALAIPFFVATKKSEWKAVYVAAAERLLEGRDFFTVETALLRRYYVLFFIELQTRRVHLAGATTNPDSRWVAQQARNLSLTAALGDTRFLIRDRDSKFTGGFDEVFRTEGIAVIQTPFRSPQANAHAERFVRTARTECLDWLLIVGPCQLDRVLRVYVDHYNTERPHRALGRCPPVATEPPTPPPPLTAVQQIERRDRLGGLLHAYHLAAA